MKKFILSAILLFCTYLSVFAQNEEEHSAEYNWGYKNAGYVMIGVIAFIIAILWAVRRRKKVS